MDNDRAAIILARIRGMLEATEDEEEETEEQETEDEEGMQGEGKTKRNKKSKEGDKVSLDDRIKTIKAKM